MIGIVGVSVTTSKIYNSILKLLFLFFPKNIASMEFAFCSCNNCPLHGYLQWCVADVKYAKTKYFTAGVSILWCHIVATWCIMTFSCSLNRGWAWPAPDTSSPQAVSLIPVLYSIMLMPVTELLSLFANPLNLFEAIGNFRKRLHIFLWRSGISYLSFSDSEKDMSGPTDLFICKLICQ